LQMFTEPAATCGNDEFRCLIGQQEGCIPKTQLCDGINQCTDKSDEQNCGE